MSIGLDDFRALSEEVMRPVYTGRLLDEVQCQWIGQHIEHYCPDEPGIASSQW